MITRITLFIRIKLPSPIGSLISRLDCILCLTIHCTLHASNHSYMFKNSKICANVCCIQFAMLYRQKHAFMLKIICCMSRLTFWLLVIHAITTELIVDINLACYPTVITTLHELKFHGTKLIKSHLYFFHCWSTGMVAQW